MKLKVVLLSSCIFSTVSSIALYPEDLPTKSKLLSNLLESTNNSNLLKDFLVSSEIFKLTTTLSALAGFFANINTTDSSVVIPNFMGLTAAGLAAYSALLLTEAKNGQKMNVVQFGTASIVLPFLLATAMAEASKRLIKSGIEAKSKCLCGEKFDSEIQFSKHLVTKHNFKVSPESFIDSKMS